jgi:DNA segregation ATPase FtsK/SpoIIIE, S-DNA-T family
LSETNLTPDMVISATLLTKIHELGHSASYVPEVSRGPVVTIYRFLPKGSTKVSHLEGLAQDFAIALGVEDVLVKRIPGETAVSVWVPNKERRFVDFKDTMSSFWQAKDKHKIPLNLGVDHLGRPVVVDLASLPHLLIAGSTGSGKSTLLGSILASIIYGVNSSDVQMVLSDTKGVEFGHFIGAPHLLYEPATSVYQTLERIEWLISEMERRLKVLQKASKQNVGQLEGNARLPYIMLCIDELADIVGDRTKSGDDGKGPTLGKIALERLGKLAQKARATGIHIIASTQRPSAKLIEGDIKSNFPSRLSFRLPSGVDSRVVLDTEGAEHLLQQGDMLFVNPNKPGIQRLHAPYAQQADINSAVEVAVRRSGL